MLHIKRFLVLFMLVLVGGLIWYFSGSFAEKIDYNTQVKPIFNIIANRVSDVVPWLAAQMLTNEKNGALLQYQPRWKLLLRFATAPFIKRNVFDD